MGWRFVWTRRSLALPTPFSEGPGDRAARGRRRADLPPVLPDKHQPEFASSLLCHLLPGSRGTSATGQHLVDVRGCVVLACHH